MVKGKANPATMQAEVAARLEEYKKGIEKIGVMLKDQQRTNFVVVCIAEHLSINESSRLLEELDKKGVATSHMVVNQLVTETLRTDEFGALDALLARAKPTPEEASGLLTRVRASVHLTNARRTLQQKYLAELRKLPVLQRNKLTVVEVPLLPGEITGSKAILNFSQRLVPPGFRPNEEAPTLLTGWTPTPCPVAMPMEDEVEELPVVKVGDKVTVQGLAKAAQYNGLTGTASSLREDGRFGVELSYKGQIKMLALKAENLAPVADNDTPAEAEEEAPAAGGPMAGLEAKLLADPEIVEALKDPKYKAAFDDVKANPMNFFQYMSDPELGPFVKKMMGKLGMGGGFGGM